MHHSEWKEVLQAWGWVEVDRPGKGSSSHLNFAKREQAIHGLREGCALAKIQYHNDMWEVVKVYDDPPKGQSHGESLEASEHPQSRNVA